MQIRYVGLSNETPYGLMKFLQVSENESCYPRIISVQVLVLKLRVCFSLFLKWLLTTVFPICRTLTTCFAEILIWEWLNAVIMKGINFVWSIDMQQSPLHYYISW